MVYVGIVGLGYWGPNLLRNLNVLDGVTVKYACDQDSSRLQYFESLYPQIQMVKDHEVLLKDKDLNAVVIATPVSTHYPLAKEALNAGKHVFVEKPLAASVEECSELTKLAEAKSLTLMVGHTFVYTPQVRKIREIIQKGDLGQVKYIASRRLNLGLIQKDINVAWDLAPHDLSIILYLLGEFPKTVSCTGKASITGSVEEVVNMTLHFPSGEYAMIHSSWIDPRKVREMTIVGSQRMIVYDDTLPLEKIKIYDKRVEAPPHYDTFAEFHYSYHYGDVYSPYLKQEEPLKVECAHFVECIETGIRSESSGIEGMKIVQILEAASQSIKEGGSAIDPSRLGK